MVLVDDFTPSGTNPVASACFRLGWQVEELFSQFEIPEHPPRAYDLARLPGLSKLTSYDWQRLGLDQVDFVVSQVTAKAGTPASVPLNLSTDARSKLEVMIQGGEGTAQRREEYRTALSEMHVNLLITLTAFSFLAVVLVLLVIPGSAVARTATGVAAFAGTLGGSHDPTRRGTTGPGMRISLRARGHRSDHCSHPAAGSPLHRGHRTC